MRHSYYFGLRVGTHLATAYFRAGERAHALAALRKVLDAGIQGGLYQTILDQGPEIGTLLLSVREQMPRTGDPADFVSYVDRLVEGFARVMSLTSRRNRPSLLQSRSASARATSSI